jgi:thioredoxin reductase (NADPH)
MIIVGAGPAGLTAALYAARSGMDVLVLERIFAGGQIARAHMVENYPGFPEGISGVDLGLKFKEQAERHGAKIVTSEVTEFKLDGYVKALVTSEGEQTARTVVLAMGAKYKSLGLRSEKKYVGRGVSYCATCDGAFFRGKDVAVIGGGNTALEDALYLTGFCSHIYVVHRRGELRGEAALQKAAMASGKIEFLWYNELDEVLGEAVVTGMRVRDYRTDEKRDVPLSGVFVAIGQSPETTQLSGLLEMDDAGYIVTDSGMRTSVPGVFAAGDIVKKQLRQVVTAAADGAVAVSSAHAYLHEVK